MTKQQATDTEYDTVTYEYDELNRVILTYDGLSYTQYFHDQYGNIEYMAYGHTTPLSSIEDADSETAVTHYEYDKLNRLVKLTDPMGFTETYTYDKLGNMLTKTDKNGVVTTYTYDYAGNILSKTAGNSYVNYEYNECGNPLSITNETGVISYEYDYLEQIFNVRYDPTDINAKGFGKLALDSDNNGNLTFSVFEYDNGADGTNYIYSEYEYDELNRMTNACIEGEEVDYEYDNNSNLIKKTANGVSVNMSYTDSKQLGYMEKPYETDYDDENGMANGYYITHYPNGNISQIYDAYTDTNTTYTYDRQGRLTESSCEDGSGASYSYDTRGNLTSMYIVDKSGNTYDSVMTSDINNRLISKTTTLYGRLWFKSDYTYDNNGNCISELITSNELSAEGENEYVDIFQDYATIYEYDEFNRLTRHMGLLIDEEYTYYGNNLRMGIYDLEGNLTTQHIYDGQNVVVDVTRDGTYTYKRGLDLVSRSKDGGEEEYYYFDPHGSVRAIVSETGEILDKYEYSDYGEVIGEYYVDNPFKYCAEYQDYSVREPKIYLRNRYYQPSTGRFLTSDPIKDGLNWYMYCGGDPVNYVDPWGLEEKRDKEVLTNEDYEKIQMLTAIYDYAKYSLKDMAIADEAHRQAVLIRQQDKYKGVEGYGPVRPSSSSKKLQFSTMLGAVDNYEYSKSSANVGITIDNPLSVDEAERESGEWIDTMSDAGIFSAIAAFFEKSEMAADLIAMGMSEINKNTNPLYGKVSAGDTIVYVNKTQSFPNKKLKFYFSSKDKSYFYYVKE